MRPLFIRAKSSGTRVWWWAVLTLVLLSAAAVLSWEGRWVAPSRLLLGGADTVRAEAPAPATLTEPGPAPVVVPAWPEPSDAASASAPAVAPVPPNAEDDTDRQVQAFVERWAASWSDKRLEAYFAAYAEQFQPEGQKTVADWARERKQRITSKNKIAVQIKDFTIVSSDHSGLKTSFVQTYEADGFRSTSPKVLLLTRQDGAWKIMREYTP